MRGAAISVLRHIPVRPRGVVHLFLHDVPNRNAAIFERLMDRLLDLGPIVSLEEGVRLRAAREVRPTFTLSFDDGFRDNVTVAGPILARRGIPATIFVSADFVGLSGTGLERFCAEHLRLSAPIEPLSRDDLRRCVDLGLTIGSHAESHSSLATLDDTAIRRELSSSRLRLREWSGQPVDSFAWPFGTSAHFPQRAVELAREAGYVSVFSGMSRLLRWRLEGEVEPRRQIDLNWGIEQCLFFAKVG
jgi:peptidoglycan/xylan/chitin deacetylase (PgdA/CDA1 family)